MKRALSEHVRDLVALAFMVLIAAGVAGYVLSNQRFYPPSWVPVVGTDFYDIKAELPTAQAVAPGQGQTVDIAGVKVGEIGSVRLQDGHAVVDMKIQRRYAPVYRDATILLRPKTGLKDMVLELDPGSKSSGSLKQGERIRVTNTLQDVNPDEVLASLDTDTRDYLRILLDSGGRALDGDTPAQLRQTLRRFEPTARDAGKITSLLAQRRRNVARVVHNFQLLATELGDKDRQLAGFVNSANQNFSAIASQDQRLRESLRLAPGTLDQTTKTLTDVGELSDQLGPALQKLRPGARALGPSLRATRPFLRTTTPVIRDQIRPFARDVRPTIRDLRRASSDLGVVTPHLTNTFGVLNKIVDALAYNPPGADEGFLFWLSWLNHNGASVYGAQDANGPLRRGLVLVSCPALSLLNTAVRPNNPQLDALTTLVNFPNERTICPNNPVSPVGTASSAGAKP